jgi:hypothetical protein
MLHAHIGGAINRRAAPPTPDGLGSRPLGHPVSPINCRRCKAFFPGHLTRCPSCGAKQSGWGTAARLILSFALACLIVWLVDQLPATSETTTARTGDLPPR